MQVCIPTRDCRVAVGAAIVALEAKIKSDRETVWNTSFENLLNGAVHNGLHVDENRKREMREMVDRDLEHMMEQHPGVELLQVLNNFVDMLAYHREDKITIDDQDFNLLKPHLPAAEKIEQAA
jgi:D-hexose-6-phosphate mutarotase